MDHHAPHSPYNAERAALLDRLSLLSLHIAEEAGEMAQASGIDIPDDYQLCCDVFSQMIRTHGLIERLRLYPAQEPNRGDMVEPLIPIEVEAEGSTDEPGQQVRSTRPSL